MTDDTVFSSTPQGGEGAAGGAGKDDATQVDGAHVDATQKRVVRNDDAGRYEIYVGNELGGFTEIEPGEGDRVVFPHTEIDPAFSGQGLGGLLVGEALADTARRGETIVPKCSFVRKYLRENDVAGAVVDWPRPGDAQDAAAGGEQSS